jgi:hypothetical protein
VHQIKGLASGRGANVNLQPLSRAKRFVAPFAFPLLEGRSNRRSTRRPQTRCSSNGRSTRRPQTRCSSTRRPQTRCSSTLPRPRAKNAKLCAGHRAGAHQLCAPPFKLAHIFRTASSLLRLKFNVGCEGGVERPARRPGLPRCRLLLLCLIPLLLLVFVLVVVVLLLLRLVVLLLAVLLLLLLLLLVLLLLVLLRRRLRRELLLLQRRRLRREFLAHQFRGRWARSWPRRRLLPSSCWCLPRCTVAPCESVPPTPSAGATASSSNIARAHIAPYRNTYFMHMTRTC